MGFFENNSVIKKIHFEVQIYNKTLIFLMP